MPGKTRKVGKSSKRYTRKVGRTSGRKSYKTNNIVGKTMNPFPQRTICKMKYAESVLLDAANSYAYHFNLNSIWDPNRSGIGHQPYGRDQYAQLYNRYRVIACKYHVWFPASGAVSYQMSCVPSNETQVFSSVAEARENPRGKFKIQMPGGNAQKISGNVYIPSLVGRTKAQYMADDRYQAQMDANPAEAAILNLQAASVSDVPSPVTAVVMLEYVVELFDAKTLTGS